MSDIIDRGRFLIDSRPESTAFGLLTRWTVDDLDEGRNATGLAGDVDTARLAAMEHIYSVR